MSETRRLVGFLLGLSAIIGVAVGLGGHVAIGWARTQFLTGATGNSPETFGPVFLALVFFQTTVTVFVVGTALSALLGALAGSRLPDFRDAVVVGVGGGGGGYYVMAVVAVVVLSFVGGPGTGQTYGLGQALGPLAVSGIPAVAAGAVGAVAGSLLAA
jgi:hypothetical protein